MVLPILFCEIDYRRGKKRFKENYEQEQWVEEKHSVSIIIPVYNEQPDILQRCIDSCRKQDADDLEVIVVDDGSTNREELIEKVYSQYDQDDIVSVILPASNQGKREAQKVGFDIAKGSIFVTVDSDTVIEDPRAVSKLIYRFQDPAIGAVTGDVTVANKNENFLTKLTYYKYWTAFFQERSAQSLFGVMNCCSGPFSAYRASVIKEVEHDYVNEYFLGMKCTFGDDRHLTNLLLRAGYDVVFEGNAQAFTWVPNNWKSYITQQVRWAKSFYREMIWTARFVHGRNFYLYFDMSLQLLLPLLLLLSAVTMIFQSFVDGTPIYFANYIVAVFVIALLRALYGFYRTHDKGFLIYMFYGFIHIFLMMPIRIYALFTLRTSHWGTR